MFASTNLGGYAGDVLIRQRRMPTARARKVVNTLGMPILLRPVLVRVWLDTAQKAQPGFSQSWFDTARKQRRRPAVRASMAVIALGRATW